LGDLSFFRLRTFANMFKTGYLYHWITSGVFIILGLYLLIFSPEVRGINAFWFGIVIILWGLFRGFNGYLLYKRKETEHNG
jgi:hypothetical protein